MPAKALAIPQSSAMNPGINVINPASDTNAASTATASAAKPTVNPAINIIP